jgi:hypothetical protein
MVVELAHAWQLFRACKRRAFAAPAIHARGLPLAGVCSAPRDRALGCGVRHCRSARRRSLSAALTRRAVNETIRR